MTKPILLLLLSVFTLFVQAQSTTDKNTANVAVTVMDTKGKLQKGEEVLFISEKNGKQFSCRTAANGKTMAILPVGDVYTIKLKTLKDTAMYSTIDIPPPPAGSYYTAPFTVEIEFEHPRSFTLDNVHFDTGKPTLRPESYKELNEIAEYMKWKEEERYEIAGHTDNVGREDDNAKLSQARAAAVKAYLVKKGISAARLVAKGYGATAPLADNATEEGRQANRRTEVRVL